MARPGSEMSQHQLVGFTCQAGQQDGAAAVLKRLRPDDNAAAASDAGLGLRLLCWDQQNDSFLAPLTNAPQRGGLGKAQTASR